MFSCAACSKDFVSQGSLARHLQNHSKTVKHTCNICGVFFRRRDLLTRHLKLHDNTHSSNSNSNHNNHYDFIAEGEATCESDTNAATRTGSRSGTVSRRRCHTACNRCRDLKIKCDGKKPCSRCLRAGTACDFDQPLRSSGRISQVDSTAAARAPSPANNSLATALSFAADAEETPHISMPPSFSPTSFTGMVPDPGVVVRGNLQEQVGDDDNQAALDVSLLPWDALSDQVMPWPWLHENLFLSRDDFDILASSASQQLSFPDGHAPHQHLTAFQPLSDICRNANKVQPEHLITDVSSRSDDHRVPATAATYVTPPAGGLYDPALTSPPFQDGDRVTRSPDENNGCKQRAVDALVSLAAQAAKGTGARPVTFHSPPYLWSQACQDFVASFDIELQTGQEHGVTTEAALQQFVRLYSEHFHQLWPLLPRRTLESGVMHPLLYLVLASIGAMYMGGSGTECGTWLHNAVRLRLVQPLDLDEPNHSLVWLAQARLLTQVAALYFGQPRAFSYAQHLGTLLTAQARRMRLFCGSHHQQQLLQLEKMRGVAADSLCLDLWLSIEERRRLAFGVFRGDTFTSVLLNSKPLLSLEEIALEFPTCNSVFNGGADLEPRLALDMIEHHRSPNQDVRASDVFHVLLERNEILPPLEPLAHEILLFGLQSHIWRFSYDRQLLERLTLGTGADLGAGVGPAGITEGDPFAGVEFLGCDVLETPSRKRRRDTSTSDVDSLDNRSYQMADLLGERQRLIAAMEKWERALPLAKTFARTEEDRSYLLSSLILYHLSFMRLYAPVDDIHQIHYRLLNKQSVPQDIVTNVLAWKRSARARIAVKRVRSVLSLVTQETQRDQTRSQFNFNAFVGLHHGAGILWAYHGAPDLEQMNVDLSASSNGASFSVHHGDGVSPTLPLHADNAESTGLLQTIEGLVHAMSPAKWSSFAEVARSLTTLDFPTRGAPANEELQFR